MKIQLIDSVKNAVDYVISNGNYEEPPEINVTQGSEAGDGYGSKTYAITISSKNGTSLNLFVKYIPDVIGRDDLRSVLEGAFQMEFKFYNEIYPILNKFQESRNIKYPFNNVPKHFRTDTNGCGAPPIILENLRSLGYTLRDRKRPVDEDHLILPIKAFGRFHAISFTMKDQEPEKYEKLCYGVKDFFTENLDTFGFDAMVVKCVDQFLDGLDPVKDKKYFDHCENLPEILIKFMHTIPEKVDEYAVLTQGDCWSNNMMFCYNEKTGDPIDVKLIDWQCLRINSPLLDFSYFFYTLATKEHLDNADYYLNLYYEILSERIRELGTDPNKAFPYNVFLEHWKKFCLFGLCMGLLVVKAQLYEKDEIPDLLNSKDGSVEVFAAVLKDQDTYVSRINDIVGYFIDKGII